jgi:hypothetical protein
MLFISLQLSIVRIQSLLMPDFRPDTLQASRSTREPNPFMMLDMKPM